jgi:hypothetical protein
VTDGNDKRDPGPIMRRRALYELANAFWRATLSKGARSHLGPEELARSGAILRSLAEERLPDLTEMKRLAGSRTHVLPALFYRAVSALEDPRACPSCGDREIASVESVFWKSESNALVHDLAPCPAREDAKGLVNVGLLLIYAFVPLTLPIGLAVEFLGKQALELVVFAVLLIGGLSSVFFILASQKSARNRKVSAGVQSALRVWRPALYCLNCQQVFYGFNEAPEGIPERTLIQVLVFRRMVWDAGGYGHRMYASPSTFDTKAASDAFLRMHGEMHDRAIESMRREINPFL